MLAFTALGSFISLEIFVLQIHALCYARRWEARVAAGHCLRLLAEHLQHFTPAQICMKAGVKPTDLTEAELSGSRDLLKSLDMQSVLDKGKVLLQSGGEVGNYLMQEIIICNKIHAMLRHQKSSINKLVTDHFVSTGI